MTTQAQTPQPMLQAFLKQQPTGWNYHHIYLEFVFRDEDNKVRGYGEGHCTRDTFYTGLHISCQIDDAPDKTSSYGWQLEYRNFHCIRRQQTYWMYRTLDRIYKKFDKLKLKLRDTQNDERIPATYGQFCQMMAQVIGVKTILFPVLNEDGIRHEQELCLDEAMPLLDAWVEELKQQLLERRGYAA